MARDLNSALYVQRHSSRQHKTGTGPGTYLILKVAPIPKIALQPCLGVCTFISFNHLVSSKKGWWGLGVRTRWLKSMANKPKKQKNKIRTLYSVLHLANRLLEELCACGHLDLSFEGLQPKLFLATHALPLRFHTAILWFRPHYTGRSWASFRTTGEDAFSKRHGRELYYHWGIQSCPHFHCPQFAQRYPHHRQFHLVLMESS